MSRRKIADPIPAEIAAMSLEELQKAHDWYGTDEAHAEFGALCAARDEAQVKLSAHRQRSADILNALVQKLYEATGGSR